jgi:ABC-type transporter Mla subunit MlaD
MPSEARKNLTRSQLWETVNQAMDNTRPIVAERTAELEQALSDDSRFLSALRNYLEQPESNVIFRS